MMFYRLFLFLTVFNKFYFCAIIVLTKHKNMILSSYKILKEKFMEDNQQETQNKKAELWQATKFLLFSISAGVIQLVSFTLLSEVAKLPYWPSNLISLALSVIWNFTFNRKFTFKSAANVPLAMLKAFLFYIPFTPISVFGGQALVNAGWNEFLVEGLTMVLNFVLEYFYSKFVTFRNNIGTAENQQTE